MKTAEEILDGILENYTWVYNSKNNALLAMETYATQQTADPTTRLAKANSDKEKLGKVLNAEINNYRVRQLAYNKDSTIYKALQAQIDMINLVLTDCGITL